MLVKHVMVACAVIAHAHLVSASEVDDECYIAQWQGNKKAALTMTFDDGLKEHYTTVFPELNRRGLVGTFYVIGTKVGRDQKGTPCCSWDELREMADGGMEIGSHGYHHLNVEKLSADGLKREIECNDSVILRHTGRRPLTYCFPGNRKTPEALALVDSMYVGSRTFQSSVGSKRDSLWLAHWLRNGIRKGEWLVSMTHGISTGYDCFTDGGRLWRQHLDDIVSLKTDLWVATMADVLAYQKIRDSAVVTVSKTKKGIRISVKTKDRVLHSVPLTLVVKGHVREVRQGTSLLPVEYNGGTSIFNVKVNAEDISVNY